MKFQVILVLGIVFVQSVEPIPLPDFLRRGFRWIQENISTTRSQDSQIIESVVNYSSSVIDIANVGNMLQLPLEINTLVAQRLTAPGLQIVNRTTKRTNLLELAKSLNLTILVQKVVESGLDDVLDHEGPFTLFAPTNEAFQKRPKYCDNVALKDLMKYHIGRGAVPSSQFKDNLIVNALLSKRSIRINLNLETSIITANGRAIKSVDNRASNGVLHVLDNVMCAMYQGSVIFQVNRCSAMSTLAKLVNVSGLYTLLDGPSPVTLFAPTNAAFEKLPPKVLDFLLKNVTALKAVLLYHAVPDVWYSAGLTNGKHLKTAEGQMITVTISGKKIAVNDATVTLADATARNGVVHSTDSVLIPKQLRWIINLHTPTVDLI